MDDSLKVTVWYLEVTPDASAGGADAKQMGSAVAVRLRQVGKADTVRTFLLTCRHVVTAGLRTADAAAGPSSVLIEGYKPNSGYRDPIRLQVAKINPPLRPDDDDDDDWVLLEPETGKLPNDWVRHWATDDPPEPRADYRFVGYPGGSAAFVDNIVANKTVSLPEVEAMRIGGSLKLDGSSTRKGMSGGGVFDAQDRLVSLHRERRDSTLDLRSVSASYIAQRLFEHDWEPAPAAPRQISAEEPHRARTDRQLAVRGIEAWHIQAELDERGWQPVFGSEKSALEIALLDCEFILKADRFKRLLSWTVLTETPPARDAAERALALLHAVKADPDRPSGFFIKLLDELRRRDLGRPSLLLYAVLDKEHRRTIPWQTFDQLKARLLRRATLAACAEGRVDAMLRTGAKLCDGTSRAPTASGEDEESRLCSCLNRLVGLPARENGSHPLFEFLGLHQADFGLSPDELQHWARQCDCQLPPILVPEAQPPATPPPVLQIIVEPLVLPGIFCNLEVYLEEGEEVKPLKPLDVDLQTVPGKDLPERLGRIAEAAQTKVRMDGRQLSRVELFLPSELLIQPLERDAQVEFRIGKKVSLWAIGKHWPVVIRSYDRLARQPSDLEKVRSDWERKWLQVQAGPMSGELVPWVCAREAFEQPCDQCFSDPVSGFMVLWPIVKAGPVTFDDFVYGILLAGIPVGVWVREPVVDPDAARRSLDAALRPHAASTWPKKVHDLRRGAARPEFDPRGLTLFYDRPDWNDPQKDLTGKMSEKPR